MGTMTLFICDLCGKKCEGKLSEYPLKDDFCYIDFRSLGEKRRVENILACDRCMNEFDKLLATLRT